MTIIRTLLVVAILCAAALPIVASVRGEPLWLIAAQAIPIAALLARAIQRAVRFLRAWHPLALPIAAGLRLFVGSVVVYAAVAMAYGCSGGSLPRGMTSGSGGARASSASASSSGLGSGGSKMSSGGPVPNADADESGSRIKAQRYVATDGTVAFVQWFDTMLNVVCAWGLAEDGAVRCLPVTGYDNIGFSDAACSVKAIQIIDGLPCATPAKYAREAVPIGTCGTGARVYSVAVTGTPQNYLYGESNDSCIQTSLVNGGTATAYPLTVVPPTAFVSAMLVQDKDGGA